MIFLMSLMGSLFVCSFSSIISAIVLIIFSLTLLSIMYWNMMSVTPLYLFSLFTLGGLYVLMGFTMMADIRDLDMIFDSSNVAELIVSFTLIYFGLNLFMSEEQQFLYSEFSFLKAGMSMTGFIFSSMFIFLVLFLLVFLFVIYMMMKGSLGGGGFVGK